MALNDGKNIKTLNIKLFMHLPLMISPTIKTEVTLVSEIKYTKKKNLTNNYLKGIKQIRTVEYVLMLWPFESLYFYL